MRRRSELICGWALVCSGLAGKEVLRPLRGTLPVLSKGVPANFSSMTREKDSSALRGRWFTTMCWVFPSALKATATITLMCSPRTSVV